ncbi:MAG TPA: hypothetical protein VGN57_02970 [Pirellulaceae bacterium]|jgi:hypothetical protein|nr:hypothetical protein [Pirellulaceae bacterium]
MTDRPDLSPFADDALRLRLFNGPLPEAAASPDAQVDQIDCESESPESEELFEGELPDDLLALAERLANEAHALAGTYPAGAPDRLPVGEGEPAEVAPLVEASAPRTEAASVRPATSRPSRRTFGVGTAAAIGFAAIVGATIYSAATDGSREAIAEMERRGEASPGVVASPSATEPADRQSLETVAGVPIRTVSLSLANEGDYRRLESLLRDRSEPEREAMFDLLGEKDGEERTAVRIAF